MKHLLFLSLSLCLFSFANAQKQPLQSKEITAKLEKCYSGEITAEQLAAEQFAGVSFKLDIENKKLYRLKKDKEKVFSFVLQPGQGRAQQMVLTDCPNCAETKMELIQTTTGYVVSFIEHTGDCFSFQIIF